MSESLSSFDLFVAALFICWVEGGRERERFGMECRGGRMPRATGSFERMQEISFSLPFFFDLFCGIFSGGKKAVFLHSTNRRCRYMKM